jgi:glycosyltransferase involved in cell wall biosynthesis
MHDDAQRQLVRIPSNVGVAPPLWTEAPSYLERPNQRDASTVRTTTPRILYVIGQLRPGGAERQLVFLLQAMDRERYRPAVAVWNYREDEPYVSQISALKVPIYPLPATSSSFAKVLWLRQRIKRLRPEVVHSYTFFTNIAAYLGALGSGALAIGVIQGDYFEDVRSSGWLRGSMSAHWPRVQIFNSLSALHNAGTTLSPFRPRCASVVRNGLDLERFLGGPDRALSGTPIILGVGSLLSLKRWDRLLKAAAELKRRGLDFQVEIAGDGPMRSSLESLAQELGIAERVTFLGHVPRVEDRLCAASLLAHTSDSEGCPNAVIEAMAAGLPVVATDSGDVPRLIDHGKTGFVINRGDDASLVDYVGTLLRNDALRRDMGHAGRLKAEREFRLDRLVSQTLDVYRAAGWRDGS